MFLLQTIQTCLRRVHFDHGPVSACCHTLAFLSQQLLQSWTESVTPNHKAWKAGGKAPSPPLGGKQRNKWNITRQNRKGLYDALLLFQLDFPLSHFLVFFGGYCKWKTSIIATPRKVRNLESMGNPSSIPSWLLQIQSFSAVF